MTMDDKQKAAIGAYVQAMCRDYRKGSLAMPMHRDIMAERIHYRLWDASYAKRRAEHGIEELDNIRVWWKADQMYVLCNDEDEVLYIDLEQMRKS